jgi:hypothetical protein
MVKLFPLKWDRQWLTNLNFSALLSQSARYRTGAILVVLTILTYQSVGIFYKAAGLMLIRVKTAAPAAQPAVQTPAAVADPADAFRVVAERNLFGVTDKTLADKQTASQTQAAQPDVTDTLEVRGTVAGEAPFGFAVIEDKKLKKQRLYKIGDTISGARVVRIMRNAVAFNVNDQEKILRVPETAEKGVLPTPPTVASAPPPARAGRDRRRQSQRHRKQPPRHGNHAEPGADPPVLYRRTARWIHDIEHPGRQPLPENRPRRRRYCPGGQQPATDVRRRHGRALQPVQILSRHDPQSPAAGTRTEF